MFGFKLGSKRFPLVERGRDLMVYASLRHGTESPSDEDAESDEKDLFIGPTPTKRGLFWRISVVFLLLVTNTVTFVAFFTTKKLSDKIDAADSEYTPDSWARVDTLPTKWMRLNWWTEYSDKNFTEADALWDKINPAHGFIAMDREWAKSQHWPDSMHFPSDNSKNVYLLEAYHLLHCVVRYLDYIQSIPQMESNRLILQTIIRRTFWEAIRHEEHYTFNPPHAGHCIDMLRQYVMCKADNTPLYLFGDDTAGDEQYRKCNDWDTLRQFATDHSACYRDTPLDVDPDTFPLGAHFGYCDGGNDGLVEGERRGPWKHGAVFDGPE